jgi:hypothetical protein
VLGYELDDGGFESREGLGIFLFTIASRPALEPTQPPIQWLAGALSLGVKRLGSEADLSPPSRLRMSRFIPPLPQYAFSAWCSVKAQGQIYLYFACPAYLTPWTRVILEKLIVTQLVKFPSFYGT